MAQKIRIKDIAQTAGVSGGTVDRVLHNRGHVSPDALERVEKALEKLGYKPNIHVSAISLKKKKYRIVITTPQFAAGDYWSAIHGGVARAAGEFGGIDIECRSFPYDQYDLYSCRGTFERIAGEPCDAVIIGPTFRDETAALTARLEENGTPYVFVDSMVEGTNPLAFFSTCHYNCGRLVAKLITAICPPESGYALFQAVRTGHESANTTILRKKGFMDYMRQEGLAGKVVSLPFSVVEPDENDRLIGGFFGEHPEVEGAVVLSSRGSVISEYLAAHRVKGVKTVCIDLTDANARALRSGRLEFVVAQRPGQQGSLAVKALMQFLVYGQPSRVENYLPLDILARENVDYYSEFTDTVTG